MGARARVDPGAFNEGHGDVAAPELAALALQQLGGEDPAEALQLRPEKPGADVRPADVDQVVLPLGPIALMLDATPERLHVHDCAKVVLVGLESGIREHARRLGHQVGLLHGEVHVVLEGAPQIRVLLGDLIIVGHRHSSA